MFLAAYDLASFSKIKSHFKRDCPIDEHLFTRDNRPKAIETLYDEAGLSRIPQVRGINMSLMTEDGVG